MALVFPVAPTDGQLYPFPAVPGAGQWQWSASRGAWVQVPFYLIAQEGAYNPYVWPTADGDPLSQLTTDGAGNLDWVNEQVEYQLLAVNGTFDGVAREFPLIEYQSAPPVPFIPDPPTNISVFLNGVFLVPDIQYQISGQFIIFATPPVSTDVFFATSVVRKPDGPTPPPPTPTIVVTSVVFTLTKPDNTAAPPLSTSGYNITPQVSWSVSTSGIVSGTTYNLIMEDLDSGNARHWELTGITGTTVSSSGIGGATIITNDFPSGSNLQGYTGPFNPFGTTHNYRISITPVLAGATVTPNSFTVPYAG